MRAEYFGHTIFDPLIAALTDITRDAMGRDALRSKLNRIVIRLDPQTAPISNYPNGLGFENGELNIDWTPAVNTLDLRERTQALVSLLERNLWRFVRHRHIGSPARPKPASSLGSIDKLRTAVRGDRFVCPGAQRAGVLLSPAPSRPLPSFPGLACRHAAGAVRAGDRLTRPVQQSRIRHRGSEAVASTGCLASWWSTPADPDLPRRVVSSRGIGTRMPTRPRLRYCSAAIRRSPGTPSCARRS